MTATAVTTVLLSGTVTGREERTSFQGNPWAGIVLATPEGPRPLDVLPKQFAAFAPLLTVGAVVTVEVRVSELASWTPGILADVKAVAL